MCVFAFFSFLRRGATFGKLAEMIHCGEHSRLLLLARIVRRLFGLRLMKVAVCSRSGVCTALLGSDHLHHLAAYMMRPILLFMLSSLVGSAFD